MPAPKQAPKPKASPAPKTPPASPTTDSPAKGGYVVLWAPPDGRFTIVQEDGAGLSDVPGTAQTGLGVPTPKVYPVDSQESARKAAAADPANKALRQALGYKDDGTLDVNASGAIVMAMPLSSYHPRPGKAHQEAPKVKGL